jgi:hypothetical protein
MVSLTTGMNNHVLAFKLKGASKVIKTHNRLTCFPYGFQG